jgi:hypothetical protein
MWVSPYCHPKPLSIWSATYQNKAAHRDEKPIKATTVTQAVRGSGFGALSTRENLGFKARSIAGSD